MSFARSIRIFLARNYRGSLLISWTILVLASVSWNLFQNHEDTIAKARIEASTIFDHNIAYRKWSTMHGGIYTRISNKNKDNPHLFFRIKGEGKDKIGFAIIDPFQVTQQAYEVLHKQSSNLAAFSHTVSLDYKSTIDPYDKPDKWEEQALKEFKAGKISEAYTITEINSAPYLKLLKPYVIDQGCLNCHESKVFKIGAVHGGMSVAIPMQPYYKTALIAKRTILMTHLLLWFLGSLAIIKFSAAFQKYQTTITQNEEKFRIVSEFAYNFEYWIKENNELAFISPSCERLTGYSRNMFMDNPKLLLEIIHPDDTQKYRHHIDKIDAAEHNGTDFRIIKKDGEIRWFTHTCSPIYINGQFLGRRGSSMDITEHKKLEARLSRTQRLEYLGQFAGGIAHDFNNVLASICTFSHILGEELADNKTAADYIKYINIAAKLGKNLTSNLLSFGKKQIVSPQKTNLQDIVTNISDILKSLVNEEIKLTIALSPNDLAISADKHQIEQILINLCTNARDAMPRGGTISISTKDVELDAPKHGNIEEIPAGRFMLLSISDTGQGIAPENITKICEPFFTTKGPSKGTGLGLAIIHTIIKQHQAFLDVESVITKGTTFRIYFPVIGPAPAAKPGPEPLPAISGSQPDRPEPAQITPTASPTEPHDQKEPAGKTILLADDDDLVRKSLSIPLERMGFKVLPAENGKKAISIFIDQKHDIDLAVLDVVLPLRNGKDIYNVIHKNNPEIPVIFISGYTDNIILEEILEQKNVQLMSKPLDIKMFIQTIVKLTTTV